MPDQASARVFGEFGVPGCLLLGADVAAQDGQRADVVEDVAGVVRFAFVTGILAVMVALFVEHVVDKAAQRLGLAGIQSQCLGK